MQTKERSPIKRLASLAVACCVGAATVLWAGAGQEVFAAPPAPKDYTKLEGLAAYDLGHYNGILFGDWQAETADNEGALAVGGNVNLPGEFSIAANGVHQVMGNYDPTTEGYPTLLLGAQKDTNTVAVSNQVDGIGHFVLRESAKDAFSAQMDKIELDGGIHYVDDTLVDDFFDIARKSTNYIISLFENLNGPTLDPAVLAGGWYESSNEIDDLSIYEVSIPALNAGKVAVVTLPGDRIHWKTPLFGSTFDEYDLVVFYAPDATEVEYDQRLTYLYDGGEDGVIFKNSGNSNNPYWAEKLLMVYPKAENVIFGGSSSIGSVIAPGAKVDATNGGSHNGMLIADSLTQEGQFELHAYWISSYIKDALDDEEDPDPEPDPGQARFTKVSTEGGTLPGAVFTLQGKDGEDWVPLRTDITSGTNGEITIDKLEAGEYRLVETQAPEGHKTLDEPVYFTMLVKDGKTIQQTVNGDVPSIANEPEEKDPEPEPEQNPGQAQFTKVSTEGGTLPGAVFTLQGKDGEDWVTLITGITSGANGEITIDKLEAGEYRLVETQAPEGYQTLDAPVYFTMLVKDGETIQQTVNGEAPAIANQPDEKDPEPEPNGGLLVWKQDAESGTPVGGAIFDMYREVFEPEQEADADEPADGEAQVAEGIAAKGVNNNSFTVLSADVAGAMDEDEPQETTGEEEAPDGSVAVEPLEPEEGDNEPAGDGLADESEATDDETPRESTEVSDVDSDEELSNEDTFAAPEEPIAGGDGQDDENEEAAMDGQEPPSDSVLAPVNGMPGDDETNDEDEETEEEGEPAMEAMAERLADWYDLEYNGRYWQLVEEGLVSDNDTGVIFASDALDPGTALLFVETAAPVDYLLPEEAERYTLVAFDGEELAVAIQNTTEEPVEPGPEPGDPGVALFWKIDSETSDGIPDAQFRLEMLDEQTGEYVVLRDDILSDSEGHIEIGGLLPGQYRLIEEIAPDGYILDETPKYFVMYEQGDETLQMDPDENLIVNVLEETPVDPKPEPVYGQIRITKCDFDDNDIMLPGTVFTLEKYTLEDTGAEQQAMPLAAVTPLAADDVPNFLYDDENWAPYPDAASYTHTTDGSGEIIVTGLVAGIYRVEEVIPPDGYDLWGDGQDVIHFVMVESTDVYGNPVLVVDSVYNNHLEVDDEVAFADRQVPGGEESSSSSSQPDTTTSALTTTGPASVSDPTTNNPASEPTTTGPENPVPVVESESTTSAGSDASASGGSGTTGSAGSGSAYAGGGSAGGTASGSVYGGSAANAAGGSAYRGAAGGSASAGSRGSTGAGGSAGAGGTKGTGSAGGKVVQTGDAGNGILWILLILSFVAILAFASMAVYRRSHRR